ncbi:MAG: hypothetical protein AAFS07_00640 [Pseudomonadota bacterium]
MGLLLLVVGIFSGLFVFIATMYSVAQAMLNEDKIRWVHLALILATCTVMAFLYERMVPPARISAVPMFAVAFVAMWMEERWFKVFPIMQQLFAAIVIAGLVNF